MPQPTVTCDDEAENPEVTRLTEDDGADISALVPIRGARRWDGKGSQLLAAMGYFAWLGYMTAPLPILLLNMRSFKRSRELAYHARNATAWSLFVAGLRSVLLLASIGSGVFDGARGESAWALLNMANIVVVPTFAVLMSVIYGAAAFCGRMPQIPVLSGWALGRMQAGKHPRTPATE